MRLPYLKYTYGRFALLFSIFLIMSCQEVKRPSENYDITNITLSEQNHSHGYGHGQCFLCHNRENIHQVDRLGHPSFDIAKDLVEQSGLDSCAGCHGNNGQ